MSFQDKRDLWYISGNRGKGDIFAVPVTEVEPGAVILADGIAQLKNSDVDGARRWIVVADSGEEAVSKLARFCLNDPEMPLPTLAREMGIPYPTLVTAAQQGRLPARKVGGRMWLSTRAAVEAAGIKRAK